MLVYRTYGCELRTTACFVAWFPVGSRQPPGRRAGVCVVPRFHPAPKERAELHAPSATLQLREESVANFRIGSRQVHHSTALGPVLSRAEWCTWVGFVAIRQTDLAHELSSACQNVRGQTGTEDLHGQRGSQAVSQTRHARRIGFICF